MGNYDKVMWRASGEESTPDEWLPKQPKNKLRTPQEILQDLNQDRKQILQKFLDKIATELEKAFKGEAVEIWLNESQSKLNPIAANLEEALKEKGWSFRVVEAFSSQKDGDNVKIRVSPNEFSK